MLRPGCIIWPEKVSDRGSLCIYPVFKVGELPTPSSSSKSAPEARGRSAGGPEGPPADGPAPPPALTHAPAAAVAPPPVVSHGQAEGFGVRPPLLGPGRPPIPEGEQDIRPRPRYTSSTVLYGRGHGHYYRKIKTHLL